MSPEIIAALLIRWETWAVLGLALVLSELAIGDGIGTMAWLSLGLSAALVSGGLAMWNQMAPAEVPPWPLWAIAWGALGIPITIAMRRLRKTSPPDPNANPPAVAPVGEEPLVRERAAREAETSNQDPAPPANG